MPWKYGFPPRIEDMGKAITEMAELGFEYIELEGVGYDNLDAVIDQRDFLKDQCLQNGVKVVNFAPLLPQIISRERAERQKALRYFERGVKTAQLSAINIGGVSCPVFPGNRFGTILWERFANVMRSARKTAWNY